MLKEQLVPNATSTTPYQAYWNNTTLDATNQCANIGCYLTSQSYFGGNADLGLDSGSWLGKTGSATGAAVSSFSFEGQTSGPTTILIELAGMARKNWFGWYDTSLATNELTTANFNTSWGIIFDGNDAANGTGVGGSKSSTSFTPNENFGFWFLPNFTDSDYDLSNLASLRNAAALRLSGAKNASNQLYGPAVFTEAWRNKGYTLDKQYFALFTNNADGPASSSAEFWMGMEDLNVNSDNDFNDMVVKFKLESFVPEPGFYGVLALGLGALIVARSRR